MLYEGWNRIKVTAGNVNEMYGCDEITVYYIPGEEDTESPVVVIEYPPDGSTFFDPVITVTGYATDNVGITSIRALHEWEGGEASTSRDVDPPQTHVSFEVVNLELRLNWNRITVFAEDVVENIGSDEIIVYYAIEDTTPPTTTKTVGEPQYDDGFYVTSETLFTLTAEDNEGGSGVKAIYYRIWYNETGWFNETENGTCTDWIEYEEPFTLPASCAHYIEYYAVDNAGNEEEINLEAYCVDDKASPTLLNVSEPYYFRSTTEVGWHLVSAPDTLFSLVADDECTLIKEIIFKNSGNMLC